MLQAAGATFNAVAPAATHLKHAYAYIRSACLFIHLCTIFCLTNVLGCHLAPPMYTPAQLLMHNTILLYSVGVNDVVPHITKDPVNRTITAAHKNHTFQAFSPSSSTGLRGATMVVRCYRWKVRERLTLVSGVFLPYLVIPI